MKEEKSQITLIKLEASEGKYLEHKDFQPEIVNEEGITLKVTPDFATIIYLAINDSTDNYIEKSLPSAEEIAELRSANNKFNADALNKNKLN